MERTQRRTHDPSHRAASRREASSPREAPGHGLDGRSISEQAPPSPGNPALAAAAEEFESGGIPVLALLPGESWEDCSKSFYQRGSIKDSIPGSFPGSVKPSVRVTGRAARETRGSSVSRAGQLRARGFLPREEPRRLGERPRRHQTLANLRQAPGLLNARRQVLTSKPEKGLDGAVRILLSALNPPPRPHLALTCPRTWTEEGFLSHSPPQPSIPQALGAPERAQSTPLPLSDLWGKEAWAPGSSSRTRPASFRASGATFVIWTRRVLSNRDWGEGRGGKASRKAF